MSNTASESTTITLSDSALTESLLTRICDDMVMMLDRQMPVGEIQTARANSRPAGKGGVHISFRFGTSCQSTGRDAQGAVLIPLPDAIAMAGFLSLTPHEQIVLDRKLSAPDDSIKEGLMELSNLIAGAINGALQESTDGDWNACSLGCQGVRAGIRPAFAYTEGDELITAEMETQVGDLESFKLVLMLPSLDH